VAPGALVRDARAAILARVASAASGSSVPVPRTYRGRGDLQRAGLIELFCERVGEYRAAVERCAEGEVADVVADVCGARGARTLVAPRGLPAAWRPRGVELVPDAHLSPRALDALDGALTGCTVAIAETGTIVLTAGDAEGRRALTLVPDLHVCVVGERQVVQLLPEALARLEEEDAARRPLTFVSGPSATSDIELSRVEGVHGPRDLVVVVVEER